MTEHLTVRTVDVTVESNNGGGYDVYSDLSGDMLGSVRKIGHEWNAWDTFGMPFHAKFTTRRDAIAALTIED